MPETAREDSTQKCPQQQSSKICCKGHFFNPFYPLSNFRLVAKYVYDPDRCTVVPSGNLDSGLLCGGMYDLSISDIKSNVVDPLSGTIADNITRAHLGAAYHTTHAGLSAGRMRELYACCVTHYVRCKSGTVNTGIRICSTVFVTVSYKLKCICNNLGAEVIFNIDLCL